MAPAMRRYEVETQWREVESGTRARLPIVVSDTSPSEARLEAEAVLMNDEALYRTLCACLGVSMADAEIEAVGEDAWPVKLVGPDGDWEPPQLGKPTG